MSFWKKAGEFALKAGSAALDEAKSAQDRKQQYEAEMPSKSDSQLAKIAVNEQSSSPLKASVAYQELKSRGYTPEEIKQMA